MPDIGSSSKKGKKKGSSKQTEGNGDTEMPDAGSPSKEKKKKNKNGDTATRRRKWEAGQTRKGERILGWRPFYKTDRKTGEKLYNGCQFVIEKEGHPNPIALVSGGEVGNRVVDAYRNLPEEEQFDIRYSEERYTYEDANRFDTLLGFACKPFNTKTEGSGAYYPAGYGLYSFTDGSQDLVSRDCIRKVFGKTDADNEIADFYEEIDETPPWEAKPKKLLTSGSEVKRQRKPRKHTNSDSESESDSDSSSMFVSAGKKATRHGRDGESSNDNNSSSDESDNKQKGSRIPQKKRNSKTKKTKNLEAKNNQSDALAGILQNFLKQIEENRRQTENMSKKFEEVLSRIPVSAAA
ncbi:hypothetical protein G7Y89_g15771 [Cudoniella acicularis]|uniref:Uncharacterized protein n=1 Tax=Cudoniella acicularis TaxID=354080 RepID=A0A8H4VJN3_9HELO|nr:hypothetical protein G7Y89_g15771 [Cudoniella acicularis]